MTALSSILGKIM